MFALLALVACTDGAAPVDPPEPTPVEVCNGVDDDGDGAIDEDVRTLWYVDADGDGIGDHDLVSSACTGATGQVALDGDCDDADPTVFPGAPEACATPGDDNCDGLVNDDGAAGCVDTWTEDADGDLVGDGDPTCMCDPGDRLQVGADCDPTDIDRGLDCTEGVQVPLEGATLRDDDAESWALLGAADVDDAPGLELVLTATGGLAVLALPDTGDTVFSDAVFGTVAVAPYSERALGPDAADGRTDLVEATYLAVPDASDPDWYTVSPTLRAYTGPLTGGAAPAWSWHLDPLVTTYVAESLFADDLDDDGRAEAWYGSGTTAADPGEAAVWRGTESGLTEVARTSSTGAFHQVVPLGDPDGDGVRDLGVVTAGTDGPTLSIHPGPVVDLLPASTADIVTYDLLDAVAVGDLDGDGYDDLALRGQRIHLLRGPLRSGIDADLAAARVGSETDDLSESALFVTAGDVGADGTRDLVVTDTYWPGRFGAAPLRGAIYVFHAPPDGVVDVRAADTRVYGTDYGAFGAYPSVLEDGRLLVGAHLLEHADGMGVFWVVGGL